MSEEVKHRSRGGRLKAADAERLNDVVLNAARSLFTSIGYERASMDQIAADARVSKRTIYSRFKTKADLFSTVIGQLGHKRLDELEAVEVAEGSPKEVLDALARHLVELSTDPETIWLERMCSDLSHDFPELAETRAAQAERMVAIVARHLKRARQKAPVSEDLLRRDARIFLSMTLLPKLHRAMMRRSTELEDEDAHFARAVEIFLRGYE